MKTTFTKAPTFTKAIIASAVFAIAYLASTSSLPSCSDTAAVLSSGSGECLERPSFLHTASGWLTLICLLAAALLLALKHKDSILRQLPAQQPQPQRPPAHYAPAQPAPAYQAPSQQMPAQHAPAQGMPSQQAPAQRPPQGQPAPVPGRTSGFCAKCGTRIIAGDRFCQGCGAATGSLQP
jgi:hypothetical protein